MSIIDSIAIGVGKSVRWMMQRMGRQASTLPGRITLSLSKRALRHAAAGRRILCITGTNGKTTTTSVVTDLLRHQGYTVVTNRSGANMQSGLMTALMTADRGGYTVLEVDEAALARCSADLMPQAILVTNIFRDQLDRYGEIDTIFNLIRQGCLQTEAQLVLCADDPRVAAIAQDCAPERVIYYGAAPCEGTAVSAQRAVPEDSGADVSSCPRCRQALFYTAKTISHQGFYNCPACGFQHPSAHLVFSRGTDPRHLHFDCHSTDGQSETAEARFPLDGFYNAYNACGALALTRAALPARNMAQIAEGFSDVKPQFGRLERIQTMGRAICFVLVKNSAGLEQAVRLLCEMTDVGGVLFFLNNRPADGEDVSWIWDADLEPFAFPDVPIGASGMRRSDMALRLTHALHDQKVVEIGEDPVEMTLRYLEQCPADRCLYLLPNYTAMLSLREALAVRLGFEKRWE